MARTQNDGRGRLGGRQKGTPNKDKPLKVALREHSLDYFSKTIVETDENGRATGRMISPYDADLAMLDPKDRAQIEIQILKFHTPQMQATAVDMAVDSRQRDLAQLLTELSQPDGAEVDAATDATGTPLNPD